MDKRLWWAIAPLAVLCAFVIGAIYFFSSTASRTTILLEIAKILLQLLAIGILGAFAKWSFDEYNHRRDQAAALNEYRKEILKRLTTVTNQVRKAPLLIEAIPSARIYAVQLQALVNSKQELSSIVHEIQTAEKAFSELEKIRRNIRIMEDRLDGVIEYFMKEYGHLSKEQTIPLKEQTSPSKLDRVIEYFMKEYGHLSKEQTIPSKEVIRVTESLTKRDGIKKWEGNPDYKVYESTYYTTLGIIREEIWSTAGIKSEQTGEDDPAPSMSEDIRKKSR